MVLSTCTRYLDVLRTRISTLCTRNARARLDSVPTSILDARARAWDKDGFASDILYSLQIST